MYDSESRRSITVKSIASNWNKVLSPPSRLARAPYPVAVTRAVTVTFVTITSDCFTGRGKKQKYAQSILLAGWVTGAMLLALGMKAIAVLAGKALMTALMSLLLSGLASFRGGGGHSEPKSTTYEIVTKPVYSHSHATAEDAHAAGSQNSPTYRRSIGGGGGVQHVVPPASSSSEEADHVVYRIHASDKTPIYIPIERRRRRWRPGSPRSF